MATITVVAAARGGQQHSLPLLDNPTPKQLREWAIQRGSPSGGGFGFMGTAQRRQQRPQGTFSLQRLRDCASQQCVPGCVEAAALGASESAAALGARESAAALDTSASTATGPASAEALHTFKLDSGASRCFFRDCTTVTPLTAPVLVSLADPTRGPVVMQASTVLPCSAVSSKSLSGLHQAPREWHDTLMTTLAALGFAPSSADPSLFLRTDTTLLSFYVLVYVDDLVFATADIEALALVLRRFGFQFSSPQPTPLPTSHSLSAPPLDESVEPSGPYPELVGCLMYLMTCTRPDLAYPLSLLARYVAPGQGSVVLTGHSYASWADDQATQRSSQGYTLSLGSGFVLWRSTRSSFELGSICEAEIYAWAMAAQELCRLAYLLTDLGERPCSPPVLYVESKAMLALCQEQRLEHRTKHIALRYFLARELQQRGQLCLSYVASRANTADVFTKALGSGDLHRFCTALWLLPVLPHLPVS
ncbi:unnamed protein product [Closterium sp. NIES-54]